MVDALSHPMEFHMAMRRPPNQSRRTSGAAEADGCGRQKENTTTRTNGASSRNPNPIELFPTAPAPRRFHAMQNAMTAAEIAMRCQPSSAVGNSWPSDITNTAGYAAMSKMLDASDNQASWNPQNGPIAQIGRAHV